jgi:beta-galactosidase
MAVIAPRLQPRGGNIIGVQLDNEIGMLAWVTNAPDLTDGLLADFTAWLGERYAAPDLGERYPFALDDSAARNAALRAPAESYAAALRDDLGHFMRGRFARYVAVLREYAEENGVTDVPFIINIHGTDRGRGLTYPIGISQLYEAYTQAPGYLPGSDHYLGDLDHGNFQDLYLMNALMDAVQLPDQPLASVEFECGTGDYGESRGHRTHPSAVGFKTRMCVAQGNRLLNYYLFAGGRNPRLPEPVGDGNDRVAFTGERHGFAAPIDPEGQRSYAFAPLRDVIGTVSAVADKLALMREERDALAWAFIPDYFMTEYSYPGSAQMREITRNLEANRGRGAWEIVARAALLAGYRFGAVDVQSRALDPRTTPVLIVPAARYLAAALQTKLVEYVTAGGKILLYGELPEHDMEARPCRILADALGLTAAGYAESSAHYFVSLVAEGWAAPRPEVRAHAAQSWTPSRGAVFMRVYDGGAACGFDIPVGAGRVIALTAQYRCDVELVRAALEQLGAAPALHHDCPEYGIFMTSTASDAGERFVHVLNLDDFAKRVHLSEGGQPMLGGRELVLEPRAALMLPLAVQVDDIKIVWATAEIRAITADGVQFRLTQPEDTIVLETERDVLPSADYTVEQRAGQQIIRARNHACVADQLTLRWR